MEFRALSWRIWLERMLLCWGMTLFIAALVYFFAFNWTHIPGWARFALAEGMFVLAVAGALAARPGVPKNTAFLAAGTLAGVFLAVFGQYYQTGADAWQLFALWTFFLLPWLALARTAALANVTLVTANLALALWLATDGTLLMSAWALLPVRVLNAAVLAALLSIRAAAQYKENRRVERTASMAALLPAALMAAGSTWGLCEYLLHTSSVLYLGYEHIGQLVFWRAALPLLALGAASWLLRFTPGFYILALCGFPLLNCALFAVIPFRDLDAMLIILLLYTGANLGYAFFLAKMLPSVPLKPLVRRATAAVTTYIPLAGGNSEPSPNARPEEDAYGANGSATQREQAGAPPPGSLAHHIVLGVAALLSALCLLLLTGYFVVVSLDTASSGPFYVIGVMYAAAGTALFRAEGARVFQKTFGAVAAAAGLACLLVVFVTDMEPLGACLPFALAAGLLYAAFPWAPLRFTASAAAVVLMLAGLNPLELDGWFAGESYAILPITFFLGALALPLLWTALGRAVPSVLRPALYAGLIVLLASLSTGAFLPSDLSYDEAMVSWPAAAHALALIPLAALLITAYQEAKKTAWTTLIAAGLALLWLFGPEQTLFGLALLTLGHARKEPLLTALGGVSMGVFLFAYYYSMELTLLAKSLRIGLPGLVLLCGGLGVTFAFGNRKTAAGLRPARRLSLYSAATLAVAVLTLGAFQYGIFDKERLLASGNELLLALAPVDPRSLMQGDYMRLDYAINRELRDQDLPGSGRTKAFALLDTEALPNGRRVPAALSVRDSAPVSRAPGQYVLALRVDFERGKAVLRARLPDSFLFQEGHAETYERARYAVLRCTPSGACLLTGLADADGATLNMPSP